MKKNQYTTVTKKVNDIKLGDSIIIGRKRPIFVRGIIDHEPQLIAIGREGHIFFATVNCKCISLPNTGEYQILEPKRPLVFSQHDNFGIVAEGDFDYYLDRGL